MIETPIAVLAFAGVTLLGLVLVAVALFSAASAIRKLFVAMDDIRAILQMSQEERAQDGHQRAAHDRRALELSEIDRKARVDVRMQGTLKLFEERQEFRVGYFVALLGTQRVILDRIKATLVNRRDAELSWTLEALYNLPLAPESMHEGEIVVGIRDLAKINLPYVPEFSFLRESCRLVMTVDYRDANGEGVRVERDVLEW